MHGKRPSMAADPIELLREHGDEHGCVNMTELYEVIARLELEEEDTDAILERLQERGIEVTDDCSRVAEEEVSYTNDFLAGMTADALQLFLNEPGPYPLRTAAQEVDLVKRMERGDVRAKDQSIISSPRRGVSIPTHHQRRG